MSHAISEKIPVGILTHNEAKFAAAVQAIDQDLFEIVQISDDYPETQLATSLEVAVSSAQRAMRDHGITVIRETHSINLDGLSRQYAKRAEQHLGILGLLGVLAESGETGSYIASAALCDPIGNTIGTTSQLDFSVRTDKVNNNQQIDWPQLIKIEGDDRTLSEYPESERQEAWSKNYRRLTDFLRWRQERVMYITGPHAAGKTEAAAVLEEEHGYPYLDLGPVIRQAHINSGSETELMDWIAEQETIHGADFTNALLTSHADEFRATQVHPLGIAVIGSRSVRGLMYIDEHLKPSAQLHLHVDAPETLLYERYCVREQRRLDVQEFAEKLALDRGMGLNDLGNIAHLVVQNDGGKEALHSAVSNAVREWELMLPSDELFYID